MGYDRGDSFPFDFKPNGIPFGSKSKGKLSPRSYPIQYERKWNTSFLSVDEILERSGLKPACIIGARLMAIQKYLGHHGSMVSRKFRGAFNRGPYYAERLQFLRWLMKNFSTVKTKDVYISAIYYKLIICVLLV